jgi:hypothetical protein
VRGAFPPARAQPRGPPRLYRASKSMAVAAAANFRTNAIDGLVRRAGCDLPLGDEDKNVRCCRIATVAPSAGFSLAAAIRGRGIGYADLRCCVTTTGPLNEGDAVERSSVEVDAQRADLRRRDS